MLVSEKPNSARILLNLDLASPSSSWAPAAAISRAKHTCEIQLSTKARGVLRSL